jgi:hypothetical protein
MEAAQRFPILMRGSSMRWKHPTETRVMSDRETATVAAMLIRGR